MQSRVARGLLSGAIVFLAGCAHGPAHGRTTLFQEMRSVSSETLFAQGVSHALRGDHLRAEQYLTAAGKRGHDPELVAAWLVRVCVRAVRYRAALGHGTQYLRDHPLDNWMRFVVANLYDALGDPMAAEAELEAIVGADPLLPLVHYRLGVLRSEHLADLAAARAHLRKYLLLAPDGAHAAEAQSILGSSARARIRRQPWPSNGTPREGTP
ncbi:MAG: hypothetical protein AAF436_15530 [Myxococcota bacterium]